MMRYVLLFLFSTLVVFAEEKMAIPAYAALSGLIVVIGIFFWGIYKAVKTQRLVYALALLPFVSLLVWMFFI